jgi:hypothetical protein
MVAANSHWQADIGTLPTHAVWHQVVHPADLVQLAHDRINPWMPCLASLPCMVVLLGLIPVDLHVTDASSAAELDIWQHDAGGGHQPGAVHSSTTVCKLPSCCAGQSTVGWQAHLLANGVADHLVKLRCAGTNLWLSQETRLCPAWGRIDRSTICMLVAHTV